jgi:hypothetical protein
LGEIQGRRKGAKFSGFKNQTPLYRYCGIIPMNAMHRFEAWALMPDNQQTIVLALYS